jgi:nucleoside-diphosphate-sugar epimerase
LHPAHPGSVYHLTKCLDALVFQFYNKNDGLRVTDLHQGIVWGTNTAQTVSACMPLVRLYLSPWELPPLTRHCAWWCHV